MLQVLGFGSFFFFNKQADQCMLSHSKVMQGEQNVPSCLWHYLLLLIPQTSSLAHFMDSTHFIHCNFIFTSRSLIKTLNTIKLRPNSRKILSDAVLLN